MSKIKTGFIEDNAVNDLKIRLRNNLALRARNAGDTADIEILKITTADIIQILRQVDMNASRISNMADPTAAQDATTKAYVDSLVAGVTDPKDAARVATTAALPASTYDNGAAGVGATLTADVNGALPSIDGVTLAVGQRILVKDQAAGLENGVYDVTQLGDGSNPWILTRSDDFDGSSPDGLVSQGALVPVAEGAVNGSLGYILTTVDPITIGTTSLQFTQFGEVIQAGQGLTKTGQTLSVDNGDGLGFNGNQLVVLVDDADFIDGTTKIVSGKVVGRRSFRQQFTLSGTDISNGYVDLSRIAGRDTIILQPDGGPKQEEALDFTVNYTGGTGGKTRVSFIGDLSTVLQTGDKVYIKYDTLDY